MRTLAYIGLLLLAAVVESSLPRLLGLSVMRPMLVIVLVLHFALRLSTTEGTLLALAGGFLEDAASGLPTGLAAFAAVALFVGVRVGFSGLRADGLVFESVFAFLLALAWHALTLVVERQLGPDMTPIEEVPWLRIAAWSALATALATPLMMKAARRVELLEKRPAGWL